MIETWDEFKKEKKIWQGIYSETPEDYCSIIEGEEVNFKKSFEELVAFVKEIGATDWLIEILTNEEGEYCGCYLESVTINKVKFSVTIEGDTESAEQNEIGIWGQLSIEKVKK